MNRFFERFGDRKEIVRGTVAILLISILQPAANFLLLPVFTALLKVEEYGYFSLLNNIAAFFAIISGLNIANAIAAFYKTFQTKQDLNVFIGKTITFSVIFNSVLLVILAVTGPLLSSFLFKGQVAFFPDVLLAIATGLFSNVFLIYTYFLRYDKQIGRFSIFSIIQVVFFISLQLLTLYATSTGVTGLLVARFSATFVMLLIVVAAHRQNCFRRLHSFKMLGKPLRYSLMTGPALLIVWLTTYGDRFLIERFMDMKSVGQYSFLATICSIADLVIVSLNSAFQPYLFDRFSGDKKRVLGFYRAFLVLSIIGISGLGMFCSNIGIFVKNEDFTATLPYTLIFLSAFIFSAISNLYAMQITFARKGSYYLWLSIIVLSINLTLNVLLIPSNGIKGAVGANVATKAILALAVIYFSQRALRVNSLRQTAALTGLFLATEYACWAIAEAGWVSFGIAGIVQFIVLILLGALNYRKQILSYLPFQTSK